MRVFIGNTGEMYLDVQINPKVCMQFWKEIPMGVCINLDRSFCFTRSAETVSVGLFGVSHYYLEFNIHCAWMMPKLLKKKIVKVCDTLLEFWKVVNLTSQNICRKNWYIHYKESFYKSFLKTDVVVLKKTVFVFFICDLVDGAGLVRSLYVRCCCTVFAARFRE